MANTPVYANPLPTAPQTQIQAHVPNFLHNDHTTKTFFAATQELENLMFAHQQRLQKANPEEIDLLMLQLGQQAKAILDKYGLTSEELAAYRQIIEGATNSPLKNQEFEAIVQKLKDKN